MIKIFTAFTIAGSAMLLLAAPAPHGRLLGTVWAPGDWTRLARAFDEPGPTLLLASVLFALAGVIKRRRR